MRSGQVFLSFCEVQMFYLQVQHVDYVGVLGRKKLNSVMFFVHDYFLLGGVLCKHLTDNEIEKNITNEMPTKGMNEWNN